MSRSENKQTCECLCCYEYARDCRDFKELAYLKDSGLHIYHHKDRTGNVSDRTSGNKADKKNEVHKLSNNPTDDVFIVHNTRDVEIKPADLVKELESNKITCQRCKSVYENAQKLLQKIPIINKNNIMGMCTHCYLKTHPTGPCRKCTEAVKKFVATKGEQFGDNKIRLNNWLSKVNQFLDEVLIDDTPKHFKNRTYSEVYTYDKPKVKKIIISQVPEKHESHAHSEIYFNNLSETPSQTSCDKTEVKQINKSQMQLSDTDITESVSHIWTEMKSDVKPDRPLEVEKERKKESIEMKSPKRKLGQHSVRYMQDKYDIRHLDEKPTQRKKYCVAKYLYENTSKTTIDDGKHKDILKLNKQTKKIHSDETMITTISKATKKSSHKVLVYFFPKDKKKKQLQPKSYVSSSTLIVETRDKLEGGKTHTKLKHKDDKKLDEDHMFAGDEVRLGAITNSNVDTTISTVTTKSKTDRDSRRAQDEKLNKMEKKPRESDKHKTQSVNKTVASDTASPILSQKENRVSKETKENKATKENKISKENKEQKGSKDNKETKEQKVSKENKETKEQKISKENKETKEQKVSKETKEQKVSKETQEKNETEEQKVSKESHEKKETEEQKVSKETEENKQTKEIKENKQTKDEDYSIKDDEMKKLQAKRALQREQEIKKKEQDLKMKKEQELNIKKEQELKIKGKMGEVKDPKELEVNMSKIKVVGTDSSADVAILKNKDGSKKGIGPIPTIGSDLMMTLRLYKQSRNDDPYLSSDTDLVLGEGIYKNIPFMLDKSSEPHHVPLLFQTFFSEESAVNDDLPQETKETPARPVTATKGIIQYALSNRAFIEKGWTKLPTEKIVRRMNVYHMRPARPDLDWFENHKHKQPMQYDTGEKLSSFDENGRGRLYYRNGRLALDYYDAEESNAQQRYVVYSSGEPDERGRKRPITVLAAFDYLGNGVVFDHSGKIRLKYNQTEGVVLDRGVGPVSHWKWHTLNDPPVLQQVMIDTIAPHKDPGILKLGLPSDNRQRADNEEMLAIEFENFVKEKEKKLSQEYKPFQIKMKALKVNENFSLKVLDQATVYLIFRDGLTTFKLNLGMLLDHHEIVDTDTADLGEVTNNVERLPSRTDSLAALRRTVTSAQRHERARTERDRKLRQLPEAASVDRLLAGASRPLHGPLRTVSERCYCNRKPSTKNLYYDTRII